MLTMLKTKQQVDKHTESILNRIKDTKERHHKCYNIARLYYTVKDYASAKKYLSMYMSVRDNYPPAHKLMGQIDEATGLKDKAIESYKRSFELDDRQQDVVLSICKIFCDTKVDPERARWWYEKAEKMLPNNSTVFELKQKVLSGAGDGSNNDELEKLLTNELVKRPFDVKLRMRHVQFMLDNERLQEAFDHVQGVQASSAYDSDIEWLDFLLIVLQKYEDSLGASVDFYLLLLNVYNSLLVLGFQQRGVNECISTLHSLDKALQRALDYNQKSEELTVFLNEVQAIVFYHAGTMLLKKAQKQPSLWEEVVPHAAACYLLSYTYDVPVLQAAWHVNASETQRKRHKMWFSMANERLCQTGYMIINLSKGNATKWVSEIKERFCNKQAQSKLFDMLFANKSREGSSSFLLNSQRFSNQALQFPSRNQLAQFEKVAASYKPNNLNNLVWIALQHYSVKDKTQPNYGFEVFENLRFSVSTHDASVLCRIDVQAFLYAAVRCTAVRLEEQALNMRTAPGKPSILPLAICNNLCTAEQAEWWSVACKMHNSTIKDNFAKARLTFQRGLECVRVMATHGMSIQLIAHLARTFEERANEVGSEAESNSLRLRASLYWAKTKEMLESIIKNVTLRQPKERLFLCNEQLLSDEQIQELLSETRYFLACEAMHAEKYEQARKEFEQVDTPDASFNLATIYRRLADEEIAGLGDADMTTNIRDRYQGLLINARDSLHTTLDRLRGNKTHRLVGVLDSELEDVEIKLYRVDNDEIFNAPDATNNSLLGTEQQSTIAFSTPMRNQRANNFSPLPAAQSTRHYQPSPERLDAQVRSLTVTQETLLRICMENNTVIKQVYEELRKNNTEIEKLKIHVDQVKEVAERALKAPPPPPQPQPMIPAFQGQNQYAPHPGFASPFGYPQAPFQSMPQQAQMPGQASMPHLHQPPMPAQPNLTQPQMQPGVPSQLPPRMPTASLGVLATASHHTEHGEEEDYYDYEDYDDYGGSTEDEDEDYPQPRYEVPDSQLVQDWPYGNATKNEGKATIAYSPQNPIASRPMPQPGFFTPPRPMLGSPAIQPLRPGFFSPQGPNPIAPPNVVMANPIGSKKLPSPNKVSDGTTTFKIPLPHGADVETIPNDASTPDAVTEKLPPLFDANSLINMKEKVPGEAPKTPGSDHDASYEGPHFEPIIPLPDKVEVKTGEEDEKVMFEGRAKLYRMDNKAWKERGLGPIKVLLEEESGKARLLMRREQILKICLNHNIAADIQLLPGVQAGVTWIWFAMDFSEDEPAAHKFCIRFKTSDLADEFKKQVDAMAELAKSGSPSKPASSLQSKAVVENKAPGSLDQFRPMSGSWDCPTCYINNKADTISCVACETVKPGCKPVEKPASTSTMPSFTVNKGGGFSFSGLGATSTSTSEGAPATSSSGFVFKPTSGGFQPPSLNKPSSGGFTFGSAQTATSGEEKGKGFTFGPTTSAPSGFVFKPTQKPTPVEEKKEPTAEASGFIDPKGGFKFCSATTSSAPVSSTGGFSFTMPSSSAFPTSTNSLGVQPTSKSTTSPISPPKFVPSGGFDFSFNMDPAKVVVPANGADKPSFGGFTFQSSPVVTSTEKDLETDNKKEEKEQKETPKPFAGFAFTKGDSSASKNVFGSGFGGLSFADASSSKDSLGGSVPTTVEDQEDDDVHDTSYEPDVDFTPLVSLPEAVTIQSGEEDEEKVFAERAKLYRYDSALKQWKERGLGEMKILTHKHKVQSRIVMRREQVLKLCANHLISADMKLTPLQSSDCAWCWFAVDFAEDGKSEENLAVRFKTPVIAARFRQIFEDCVEKLKGNVSENAEAQDSNEKDEKEAEPSTNKGFTFGAKADIGSTQVTSTSSVTGSSGFSFAKPPGSGFAFGRNAQDSQITSSEDDEVIFVSEKLPSKEKIELARKYQLPDTFYLYEDAEPCVGCIGCEDYDPSVVSNAVEEQVPEVSSSSEPSESSTSVSVQESGLDSSNNIFAKSAVSNFSFSALAASSGDAGFGSKYAGQPFSWSGAGSSVFGTPTQECDDDDEDEAGTSTHDPHYEPIVPLPDLVEVKTGEEDEEVMFSHRSKLYRYEKTLKQWKERGTGDIKILKNKEIGRYRLVLRREQVLKVVCNQNITADMELKPLMTSETAWCWYAMDFSETEGEPTVDQFAIKFKTIDLAQQFKEAFEKCQQELTSSG